MVTTRHVTRQEREAFFRAARRLAGMVSRACDVSWSASGAYRRLRETIASQEKAHRRFAPVGHRHRFSVENAVDYFVCKVVAGNVNPGVCDRKASELAGMRDDYVMGILLMCNQEVRERLSGYLAEPWPGQSADEVFALIAESDYAFFTGSNTDVDGFTIRGIAWAMTAAHNSPIRKVV